MSSPLCREIAQDFGIALVFQFHADLQVLVLVLQTLEPGDGSVTDTSRSTTQYSPLKATLVTAAFGSVPNTTQTPRSLVPVIQRWF